MYKCYKVTLYKGTLCINKWNGVKFLSLVLSSDWTGLWCPLNWSDFIPSPAAPSGSLERQIILHVWWSSRRVWWFGRHRGLPGSEYSRSMVAHADRWSCPFTAVREVNTRRSSFQVGEEHPILNRLTDALYMVRFRVSDQFLILPEKVQKKYWGSVRRTETVHSFVSFWWNFYKSYHWLLFWEGGLIAVTLS